LLLSHPAHFLSLGAGSGLSPFAPGTVGTLYAWLSFLLINPYVNDKLWALIIGIGAISGVWMTAFTARALNTQDPSSVVWDEIIAFWLVLWVISPGGLWMQCVAFVLFRYFDAAKPGPVGWADRRFKGGRGIMLDDVIAAGCTLMTMAVWQRMVSD
jgi:phosphatidylglycerophosphatase A